MKKQNLLFVGPYPPIYGGYSTQIYHLTSYLVKKGHNITVISFEKEDKDEFVDGLHVVRIDKKSRCGLLFSRIENVSIFLALLSKGLPVKEIVSIIVEYCLICDVIRKDNISVVVTYNLYESLFVPHLKEKFGSNLAVFSMVFAEIIQGMGIQEKYEKYLKSVLQSADQLICSSKYCASLYKRVGIDPQQIDVIYVGVEVEKFSPDASASESSLNCNIPPNDSVVLFFGRFLRDMGLDVILEAIPHVLAHNNKVSFLLAGANGELDQEASALQKKYPEKVFVAHNVPNDLLPDYYRKCTILVAPTKGRRACMGISIKEAMACAKPAIVSDSGGIAEAVIPNKTGIVISLRGKERVSPIELKEELLKLMESPQLLIEMGNTARQRALEIFDTKAEAEKWLQLITKYTSKQ